MTSTTNNPVDNNPVDNNPVTESPVKKSHRKHIAIGIVSMALVGGVAGTAFATTNMSQRGTMHSMSSVFHGGMMKGDSGSGHGMMSGSGQRMNGNMTTPMTVPMATAASYIGLSVAELQTQMHAGKSLADIATAQAKTVDGLHDALVNAIAEQVDSNTSLSVDQRTSMLSQISTRVTTMINNTDHQTGQGNGTGMSNGMGMGTGMGAKHATGTHR